MTNMLPDNIVFWPFPSALAGEDMFFTLARFFARRLLEQITCTKEIPMEVLKQSPVVASSEISVLVKLGSMEQVAENVPSSWTLTIYFNPVTLMPDHGMLISATVPFEVIEFYLKETEGRFPPRHIYAVKDYMGNQLLVIGLEMPKTL